MTGPFALDQPSDDPERLAVERRAHRKARALMLALTLLLALALLAAGAVLLLVSALASI